MSTHSHTGHHVGRYTRFGILLGVVGIVLGIDMMAQLYVLYKLWPMLLTLLGTGFIGIYLRRGRAEAAYVAVGVYIIGFSALALYCNFTAWSRLSFLWPVFVGLMGVSFVSAFGTGARKPLLLLSGLLFLSLGVVFYIVFELSSQLWWTVFILAGISFFIFDRVRSG
jgi:hypothetical protein